MPKEKDSIKFNHQRKKELTEILIININEIIPFLTIVNISYSSLKYENYNTLQITKEDVY